MRNLGRADAGESLRRIADFVADVTEQEMAATLDALGALKLRRLPAQAVTRTPLPPPRETHGISSEVDWV